VLKQAVCMHEEDAGMLWKHKDWRTDTAEVRPPSQTDRQTALHSLHCNSSQPLPLGASRPSLTLSRLCMYMCCVCVVVWTGAARASAGGVVHVHHRQLRLRLLLPPLAGRRHRDGGVGLWCVCVLCFVWGVVCSVCAWGRRHRPAGEAVADVCLCVHIAVLQVKLTGILSVGSMSEADLDPLNGRDGHRKCVPRVGPRPAVHPHQPTHTRTHTHTHTHRWGTTLHADRARGRGLFAPHHQHIFCARMDTAIDGLQNRVKEVDTYPDPAGACVSTYARTSAPLDAMPDEWSRGKQAPRTPT
jgi:hypothetical protein